MFSNVLVGVDRHTGGLDAAALARQLVAPDGELTLVHVYPGDPRLRRGSRRDYQEMEQRRAIELLAATRERTGIGAALRYAESPSPGRALRELAEVTRADLLVVGSSRHGRVGRILLGDDTRGALNGASCVVAVAPAGYAARVGPVGRPQSESVRDEICPPDMTPVC